MKPIYKILILCAVIFALCLVVTKKSIDYTFKQAESSQTDSTAAVYSRALTVEV